MNNSILHFIEFDTKEIEKTVKKLIDGEADLAALSEDVEKRVLNLGNSIVSEILQMIDEAIFTSSSRKARWYVEHKDEPRELVDVMGSLKFMRRGYVPKNGGKNIYLLDELLGIEKHEKLTLAAQARVLEEAVESSYAKGGREVNPTDTVSRQTVKKIVHDTDAVELNDVKYTEKKKLQTLYIVADEDHVAAQFWKKKGDLKISERGYKINTIMPKIIVVYEGVVDEAPEGSENHRYKLVGKQNFSGVYKGEAANYRLWQEVADYINERYDTDVLKRVYIEGDGAAWIKTGTEVIENSRFVLDTFHMMEYINKSVSHLSNPDEIKDVLWKCIHNCDLEALREQYNNILNVTESPSKSEEVKGAFKYLKNNWEGIKIQKVEEAGVRGCCAEGQVSHVLSDRLSSFTHGMEHIRLRPHGKAAGV